MHKHRMIVGGIVLALAGCATPGNPLNDFEPVEPSTMLAAPAAANEANPAVVEHGRYLVELLGCGSCHTDGALVGQPVQQRLLAGSEVGIAISNPLVEDRPAVVYPANLTPDPESGLGSWTDAEIAQVIRTGAGRDGRQHLPVMPWPVYRQLADDDVSAIVAYLRALAPVRHVVPAGVAAGREAPAPYVHFGVYRSREP